MRDRINTVRESEMRGRCPSTVRVKTYSPDFGRLHKNAAHMSMSADRIFFFFTRVSRYERFVPHAGRGRVSARTTEEERGWEEDREGERERAREREGGERERERDANGARQYRKRIRRLGM